MVKRKDWSKSELIVTCDIYIREGSTSEAVKHGMALTGRNDAAIKKRFGNYDYYRTNGAKGYKNGGRLAKEVWDEFSKNPSALEKESKKVQSEGLVGASSNSESEEHELQILLNTDPGKYREVKTKQRVNQDKLRKKTLVAAGHKCCLTGISDERMLIASHIKDWRLCKPNEKTDVHNALCLNKFHDGLFDRYLMTISVDGRVFYGSELKDVIPKDIYDSMISKYDRIEFNDNNRPSPEYVKFHNNRFESITGDKLPL